MTPRKSSLIPAKKCDSIQIRGLDILSVIKDGDSLPSRQVGLPTGFLLLTCVSLARRPAHLHRSCFGYRCSDITQ